MATDGVKPAPEAAQLATLGRLMPGALHELANPILALLGNAELAAAEAEPGTKLHERLETIQQTGLEISEIVRALQAYIRAQDAPVGQVGLAESASAAVALLRRVSSTRDVELSVRAAAQPQVLAQPGSFFARSSSSSSTGSRSQSAARRSSSSSPSGTARRSQPSRAEARSGWMRWL